MRKSWEIASETRTLRGQVRQTVRAAVADGTLAPGSRINEAALASGLQVSRGTLREALRRLEQEGLLVTEPHRGSFVRRLGPEEIAQVYAVRLALESAAAESAAARLEAEREAELVRCLDELASAVDAGDFARGIAADIRFHEAVCEASGNPFLLDQWRALVGLITAVMHTAGPRRIRPLQSPEEHRWLLAAVRSGDLERIRESWRGHFETGAATLAEAVRARA